MPTVPSRSPSSVHAHNTSSTSLSVSWGPVPAGYVHGVLLGFKVLYQESNAGNNTWLENTVDARIMSFAITNLTKFTKYNIQVLGFTIKGDGKPSKSLRVRTDEDGECGLMVLGCLATLETSIFAGKIVLPLPNVMGDENDGE